MIMVRSRLLSFTTNDIYQHCGLLFSAIVKKKQKLNIVTSLLHSVKILLLSLYVKHLYINPYLSRVATGITQH